MSIIGSAGLDPDWYSQSETLSAGKVENFPDLVKRVQLFNRDSILLMVSVCSWWAFTSPPNDPRSKLDLNIILKCYAPFIGALALIFCEPSGGQQADEVDLRILTGELFNIGGLDPEKDWFIEHEIKPMQSRLTELSQKNVYLKRISPYDTQILGALLLMSRTALVQWEGISFSADDWIRDLILYERYKDIAVNSKFCAEDDLQKAEGHFIGTNHDRFMKSVFLHIVLYQSSQPSRQVAPLPFDPKLQTFPQEIEDKFDIINSDLGIVAGRLSVNASSLRIRKEQLSALPTKAWLFSEHLWILHDFPLVRFDDVEPQRLIFSILAHGMQPKSANIFQHDIVRFYETQNLFGKKDRAYKLKGLALEEYLSEFFKDKAGIQKVDHLLPSTYSGARPDFIWIGEEWTILIEVKANVKINSDQKYFNSASLIDSWKILTEPIDQAKAVIGLGLVKTRKCCLLIVTNNNLVEPMTNFKRVAKHWQFLDSTGIGSLALLSLSQLETALTVHSPDDVGNEIQAMWDHLDPKSTHAKLLNYDFFDPFKFQFRTKQLVQKWKEMFPHFDFEK